MTVKDMAKELEESQIVLCTVDRIRGTIVFVKIEEYNVEATITFSEISPGRIRNIRDYVFPGKKIVCKVLKIDPRGIHLSFRRVKQKERQEFNESLRKEKSFKALLKTVLKENAEKIIENIKKDNENLSDFLEEIKEDPKILEKYLQKKDSDKIIKILQEKKEKETTVSEEFSLSSKNPDGIKIVKDIIKKATKDYPDCDVSYLAAGKYLIKIKSRDPKKSDQQLTKIMEEIDNLASAEKCSFNSERT